MINVRIHVEPIDELPRHAKLSALRGQLAFILCGAAQGIPISIAAIRKAEELARSLENTELPA